MSQDISSSLNHANGLDHSETFLNLRLPLPDPYTSLRSWAATLKKNRAISNGYEWITPALNEWSLKTTSSLLMIQFHHESRLEMRKLIIDVIECMQEKDYPVLWVLRPVTLENSGSFEDNLSPIDIMKNLILQALRTPQENLNKPHSSKIQDTVQYATNMEDWFYILELALAGLRYVYLIIDNEAIVEASDFRCNSLSYSWPIELIRFMERLRSKGSTVVVKTMLVGYSPVMTISKWRGTPVEELALWVRAPNGGGPGAPRGRNGGSNRNTLSSSIHLPATVPAIPISRDRDTSTPLGPSTISDCTHNASTYRQPLAPTGNLDGDKLESRLGAIGVYNRQRKLLEDPHPDKLQLFDERDELKVSTDSKIESVKEFFHRIEGFHEKYMSSCQSDIRVKIAVLDTGLDEHQLGFKTRREEIQDGRRGVGLRADIDPVRATKSFLDESVKDAKGHGTHVAEILLQVAPQANLYIAKISHMLSSPTTSQIANAIKWAVEMDCDIITMSFGLPQPSDQFESFGEIDEAIRIAYSAGKLLFAAASNSGGNAQRTYPASDPRVICVHATDGLGNNTGGMNPPVDIWGDNFATLGLCIPCSWGNNIVYKSGTSFATPIAAGIAANVIDYATYSYSLGKLSAEKYRKIRRGDGMRKLFMQLLSIQRDGFRYIAPWHLWKPELDDEYVWAKLRGDFNL
ncbi:peptidase S8/S53 domain-containing protein [Hypoxylon trugodes]|uniref:peptidase S8/S53 domain-containing protein n=1 Tax=Hypoxylon trugodes TaxID=326681 RepID=UPI00219D7680|nr:peptidase S8/S53 domain-containing protein [Hypoxylon trugodes]KAI1390038.1 peptidase S8/S53 domain-containing protein [Hypoxylon trugodes]